MNLFQPDRLNLARSTRRRIFIGTVVLVLTSLAVAMMADLFWRSGFDLLKGLVLVLFTILFATIAFGFSQALFGFYLRLKGGDFCRITRSVDWSSEDTETELSPTAIVMPICNEEVARVFEGLRGPVGRNLNPLGIVQTKFIGFPPRDFPSGKTMEVNLFTIPGPGWDRIFGSCSSVRTVIDDLQVVACRWWQFRPSSTNLSSPLAVCASPPTEGWR